MTIMTFHPCPHCFARGFCTCPECYGGFFSKRNGDCSHCGGRGSFDNSRWLFAGDPEGDDAGRERVVRLSEQPVLPDGTIPDALGAEVLLSGKVGVGINEALTNMGAVLHFLGTVPYFRVKVDGEPVRGLFMPEEWHQAGPFARLKIQARQVSATEEVS